MIEILSTVAGIGGALLTKGLEVWDRHKAVQAQNAALEIQEKISANELEKVRISTESNVKLELARLEAETDRAVRLEGLNTFTATLDHDKELGREEGFMGALRKGVRPFITLQWNFIAGYVVLTSLGVILSDKALVELVVNGFVSLWLTTSSWWFTNRMLDIRSK